MNLKNSKKIMPNFIFRYSHAQYFDSGAFPLLPGYGMDICRYISCPYGQQCMNGMCWSTGTSSGSLGIEGNYGSYSPYALGGRGADLYNTGISALGPLGGDSSFVNSQIGTASMKCN